MKESNIYKYIEHQAQNLLTGLSANNSDARNNYILFSKRIGNKIKDLYPNVLLEVLFEKKDEILNISKLIVTCDCDKAGLNEVINFYKLKPKDFPYNIDMFRRPNPNFFEDMLFIGTKDINTIDILNKIYLKFELSEEKEKLDCYFFYHDERSKDFLIKFAVPILSNVIGEYEYLMTINEIYVEKIESYTPINEENKITYLSKKYHEVLKNHYPNSLVVARH